MISGNSYRRGATEWGWVSVGPMIADGISTKVCQAMARKWTRPGTVVCSDCRTMIAFGRIDVPGSDCSSRVDPDRATHESQ